MVGLLCAVVCFAAAAAGATSIAGPDPAVKEWPEWPHQVACPGGSAVDPIAAFSAPTDAQRGSKPSEKALARFLRKGILAWVPRHNWRLIFENASRAEFAAGRLDPGVETMLFERRGGAWKWQGYSGGCEFRSIRGDQTAITWTLAEGQHLTPATTRIKVNLGPGECNSGRPQANRLEKPEFREQNGALLISLWLRPLPPGGYTCQGLIEPPVTIRLPEPLGKRPPMDGGSYPPRFPNPAEHGES